MPEQERRAGILLWPNETEIWIGDPDAICDGGKWLQLDRRLAKTVADEITKWLVKPTTDAPLVAVSGEDYREDFYRSYNAEDVMPPWGSLPGERKDYWNHMALAEKTLVGGDE